MSSYSHEHPENLAMVARRRLAIVLIVTFLFMFVEIIIGFLANSLTLIADAGHMLNDVISISLALVAIKISSFKSTQKQTFGYKRVEVLSGLINGLSLIAVGGYVIFEALSRFQDLDSLEINGSLMLGTAFIGLLVNIGGVYVLRPASSDSLNVEGAYQHLIADLLGSVAAIIAGIGIIFWETMWLDLIASSVVSILILKSGSSISIKATRILLESSPEGIDISQVIERFQEVTGVIEIHDFHAWRITQNWDMIMAHIVVEEEQNTQQILIHLQEISNEFGFNHPTFQIEFVPCNVFPDCIPN
ncbi:MAG: cation diffusion facilitator family transporter [Candidatus Kariarchaeaceae archaeon]|jgi:cobalt-zinc-cadmium efflux system protein